MEIIKGTATFPGIAIGKILYFHKGEYEIRQYMVSNIRQELGDFDRARAAVAGDLNRLYQENSVRPGGDARIYSEQLELLESGSFRRAIESIITLQKVNAAYAVMINRDEMSNTFRNLEEPVIIQRIANVKEISNRLIGVLGGLSTRIKLGEEPVIVAAEELTPGELMEMEKEKLLAVVTHQGSVISHAAIIAKTREIPALVDVEIRPEWDGMPAIVDGYSGNLYLNPDKETQSEYEIRRKADIQEREELLKLRGEADVTRDGKKISLYANIGNLDDLNSVLYYGAAGIGLLRSEFQYLGREDYPGENELFCAYKKVAEAMGECFAVIRTADLGADKQAPYLDIPDETNPIMGNRGVRFCLDRKRMFRAQLRAIYRASVYGNLGLMYPMISSEEEVDKLQEIVDEVKAGLQRSNIPYKEIPVGIMIETPAAVMISRELAEKVDFLSLGTNDLTQYTLAMDRQNPLLKEKYNDHHPAVLRMIRMVIEAAHEAGRRVCICGEIAADTDLTETFLKMGVDALSVVPACILPVRKALRNTDLGKNETPAEPVPADSGIVIKEKK